MYHFLISFKNINCVLKEIMQPKIKHFKPFSKFNAPIYLSNHLIFRPIGMTCNRQVEMSEIGSFLLDGYKRYLFKRKVPFLESKDISLPMYL